MYALNNNYFFYKILSKIPHSNATEFFKYLCGRFLKFKKCVKFFNVKILI